MGIKSSLCVRKYRALIQLWPMKEIELTFLPKYLPRGVLLSPSKVVEDLYIPASAKHPILRIRRNGDKYEITKKSPVSKKNASEQYEKTISLTKEEFAGLKKLAGKRVAKTRYYYKEDGATFEVGIFREKLTGLILVDIEFDSREQMRRFKAPPWLATNVTKETFLAGGMLAGKSYKDIEKKLEALGFKDIDGF